MLLWKKSDVILLKKSFIKWTVLVKNQLFPHRRSCHHEGKRAVLHLPSFDHLHLLKIQCFLKEKAPQIMMDLLHWVGWKHLRWISSSPVTLKHLDVSLWKSKGQFLKEPRSLNLLLKLFCCRCRLMVIAAVGSRVEDRPVSWWTDKWILWLSTGVHFWVEHFFVS